MPKIVPLLAAISLISSLVLSAFTTVPKAYAYTNPTTVPLLTVANFAALASSTITSPTATTTLNNGDLGTNGVCTNFIAPCTGPINGIINNGAIQYQNTAATTAQTDATAAVTNANGRTADATITGGLLNGLILTQGVYDLPATTTNLTGDLTLTGDANAVFIFRASSTLITAGTSRVLLTGGAQACNVFWTVGSQATFDGATQFVGTVFAQSAVVFSAGGATLAGRAIAQTAAITFNNTTINNSSCAAATTTTTTTTTTTPAATTTTTPAATTTTTPAATTTTGLPKTGFNPNSNALPWGIPAGLALVTLSVVYLTRRILVSKKA